MTRPQYAFPRVPTTSPSSFTASQGSDGQTGMTLREYAAVHALAGIAANPSEKISYVDAAYDAVKYADELLAELASTPTPEATHA